MAKVKAGDAVMILEREQTPQDVKSGLYYPHYAGLRGTVLKVYGDAEVAVQVDRESLPSDIRARHEEGEKAMRRNWLDKLSEEARGRISDQERAFTLNYAVLVAAADLKPDRRAGRPAAPAPPPTAAEKRDAKEFAQSARAIDPATGESDVRRSGRRGAETGVQGGADSTARRLSSADLDAREQEFLARRQQGQTDGQQGRRGGKAG